MSGLSPEGDVDARRIDRPASPSEPAWAAPALGPKLRNNRPNSTVACELSFPAIHARPAAPRGRDAARREPRAAAGRAVAVIGPSGAGRTTLLHVKRRRAQTHAGPVAAGRGRPWQLATSALQRQRGRLFLAPRGAATAPRRVVTAVLAGRLPAWA